MWETWTRPNIYLAFRVLRGLVSFFITPHHPHYWNIMADVEQPRAADLEKEGSDVQSFEKTGNGNHGLNEKSETIDFLKYQDQMAGRLVIDPE